MGLPRYDKPAAVLLADGSGLYALAWPGTVGIRFGTWAARLPSGLALDRGGCLAWPSRCCVSPQPGDQSGEQPTGTIAVEATRWPSPPLEQAALPFALSPDAALEPHCRQRCAVQRLDLSVALFVVWQCWADAPALGGREVVWGCGRAQQGSSRPLGLLAGLTLLGFGWETGGPGGLWRRAGGRAEALGLRPAGCPCPWLRRHARRWRASVLGQPSRYPQPAALQLGRQRPPDSLGRISCRLMVGPSLPFTPCFVWAWPGAWRDGARQGTPGERVAARRRPAQPHWRSFRRCWFGGAGFISPWRTKLPATGCRPRRLPPC